MPPKQTIALQCLVSCLVCLLAMFGFLSFESSRSSAALLEKLEAEVQADMVGPPDPWGLVVEKVKEEAAARELSPKTVLFGGGALVLVWFLAWMQGARLTQMAGASKDAAEGKPVKSPKKKTESKKVPPKPSIDSGVQVLALLQRKGRLIDFLQEDLSEFEDDQIGAAVRSVHEGCREALTESVKLEPVFKDE